MAAIKISTQTIWYGAFWIMNYLADHASFQRGGEEFSILLKKAIQDGSRYVDLSALDKKAIASAREQVSAVIEHARESKAEFLDRQFYDVLITKLRELEDGLLFAQDRR